MFVISFVIKKKIRKTSATILDTTQTYLCFGFNPCFSGRPLQRTKSNLSSVEHKVSILVFLEDLCNDEIIVESNNIRMFQSLFFWKTFATVGRRGQEYIFLGFNPCFSGISLQQGVLQYIIYGEMEFQSLFFWKTFATFLMISQTMH